jgi:hypothetical protein
MKFTQLVNEKLKLYGEAGLPMPQPGSQPGPQPMQQPIPQPDAALPAPAEPKPATIDEIDALKQDTDSKVSALIKKSIDTIANIVTVLRQTFASELNSTKGGILGDKLQEIIDIAGTVDTESATLEKLNEIQSKVKDLLPGGEV